jgi:Skp family chaperone for outer membrane proteins
MGENAARELVTGNDVQVIREILFGEQSQKISEHFSKLEAMIAALQQENQQLRKELETEAKARQDALAELNSKINERLEQVQLANSQEFETTRKKHDQDMNRLVSLLASALADYQEPTK